MARNVPYRPFERKVKGEWRKVPGVYVRHRVGCPAYLPEDARKRCRCEAMFKTRVNSKWSTETYPDEATALTALGARKAGRTAVVEREAEGWTFGRGADEWKAGVEAGTIARRRRGNAEGYAASTLPDYLRIVEFLCDDLELRDRLAREVDAEEWWDIFEGLKTGALSKSGRPLSYSRRASIRSVASDIYAHMAQRPLQRRTGVRQNPLGLIDLGANDGQVRERVALPEEADELLAALQPADQVPFAIALNGGPRRGIIRRIDWTDVLVELDGKKTVGNWLLIRPLDSERGRGRGKLREQLHIPMAPQLRRVLLNEWSRQGRPDAGPVVARSVISGRLYTAADKAWATANTAKRERLGRPLRKRGPHEPWSVDHELEPIRLHECRHTYASWLMASRKWSVRQMMEFMGLTQMSTFERYAKVIRSYTPHEEAEVINLFAQEG